MYLTHNPPQRRVYRRTIDGQKAALSQLPMLTAKEKQLLLMLNGETPLDYLYALAPDLREPLMVNRLMHAGLIEQAG